MSLWWGKTTKNSELRIKALSERLLAEIWFMVDSSAGCGGLIYRLMLTSWKPFYASSPKKYIPPEETKDILRIFAPNITLPQTIRGKLLISRKVEPSGTCNRISMSFYGAILTRLFSHPQHAEHRRNLKNLHKKHKENKIRFVNLCCLATKQ